LIHAHYEGLIGVAATVCEAERLRAERLERLTRLIRRWNAGHPQRN
jgi:hypothetical protein